MGSLSSILSTILSPYHKLQSLIRAFFSILIVVLPLSIKSSLSFSLLFRDKAYEMPEPCLEQWLLDKYRYH